MLVFHFLYMNQQGEVSVKNETTKTKKSGVTYTASGIIKVVDKTTLKISELPVKISMENYEKKLKTFMDGEDKFIKVIDYIVCFNHEMIVAH